jgi:hypothetical protein
MYLQRKSKQYSESSLSQSDEVSSKITKIAITVSVVFAFSYVPLYVIKLLTSIINQEELTSAQFAVLKIVERSYVINPYVEGTFYVQSVYTIQTKLRNTMRTQMSEIHY